MGFENSENVFISLLGKCYDLFASICFIFVAFERRNVGEENSEVGLLMFFAFSIFSFLISFRIPFFRVGFEKLLGGLGVLQKGFIKRVTIFDIFPIMPLIVFLALALAPLITGRGREDHMRMLPSVAIAEPLHPAGFLGGYHTTYR